MHDLAYIYGFQLINHEELFEAYHSQNNAIDNDGHPINDTPITVSLQNCYHCLASSRNKKRTLEHQNSMVVKKYGSMVNTLEGSHNQ